MLSVLARVYSCTNWGEKKPGLGLDPPTLHKLANEAPPLRSLNFPPARDGLNPGEKPDEAAHPVAPLHARPRGRSSRIGSFSSETAKAFCWRILEGRSASRSVWMMWLYYSPGRHPRDFRSEVEPPAGPPGPGRTWEVNTAERSKLLRRFRPRCPRRSVALACWLINICLENICAPTTPALCRCPNLKGVDTPRRCRQLPRGGARQLPRGGR